MSPLEEFKALLDYLKFVKHTGAEREAKGEARGYAKCCQSVLNGNMYHKPLSIPLTKELEAVVELADKEGLIQ